MIIIIEQLEFIKVMGRSLIFGGMIIVFATKSITTRSFVSWSSINDESLNDY